MWYNTFKSSIRSIVKNRSHAVINLIGLSLGITSALILFLVVRFELSFDNYQKNRKDIFRVVTERVRYGEQDFTEGITYPLPEAIRNDFPEIKYVTIVDTNEGDLVFGIAQSDASNAKFKESSVAFVSPDYFRMFDYNWIEGGPDALETEKSIVIDRSLSKKYFGDESPMGKVISINSQFSLTVTGWIEDPPANTDLPFNAMISNKLGADKQGWDNWDSSSDGINCYLQIKHGTSAIDLQKKMKGWHLKYFTGDQREEGETMNYFLQPLSEVHFDDRFGNLNDRVISKTTIFSLALIGALLLLTACINFINLNTVLIFNRAKEVGIRKTLGGSRFHLLGQFLSETFVIALISLIVSTGLVELSLLKLTPVLGYRLDFNPITDSFTLLLILSFPILITILAGLYPAFSLASFNPVSALKNKLQEGHENFTLRRSLIVVQLVISQALIICTIVVLRQMNFFLSQPMGLNSSAIVEFPIPENRSVDILTLKDRIANIPGIQSVSMSNTGSAGQNSWGGEFESDVNGVKVKNDVTVKFADKDFVKTYRLELLMGEDLIRSDSVDRFLVNEAFVRALGLSSNEEAIGVPTEVWGRKAMISGVVKNFNPFSLKDEIPPVIIIPDKKGFYTCAVKLSTTDIRETMSRVGETWENFFPAYVFEYSFLDDTIGRFYEKEKRTSLLLSVFSSVAILIGCIGLFGLISFVVSKRTKEVGIRKTLGASVLQIISLFTKEFVVLTIISFVIAAPVSYYFMSEWLDSFAYRININISTFLSGIALLFLIVFITTGVKTFNAAIANPIDSLKDE